MAYLAELDRPCEGGCGRRAVVELRDRYNAPRGRWCRGCGERELRVLDLAERGGGPPAEDPAARARELRERGMSLRQIAGAMGVSTTQVRRLLGLLDDRGMPIKTTKSS